MGPARRSPSSRGTRAVALRCRRVSRGYTVVLGGGLPSLVTRRLLSMGGWMMVERVVNGLRADVSRRA